MPPSRRSVPIKYLVDLSLLYFIAVIVVLTFSTRLQPLLPYCFMLPVTNDCGAGELKVHPSIVCQLAVHKVSSR